MYLVIGSIYFYQNAFTVPLVLLFLDTAYSPVPTHIDNLKTRLKPLEDKYELKYCFRFHLSAALWVWNMH